ncbi:MAG: hypothetical protein PVI78_08990, partial [Anaerolineales bacterium]
MRIQRNLMTASMVLSMILTAGLAACSPVSSPQDQPNTGDDQVGSDSLLLSTPVVDMTTVDDQGNTSIDPESVQDSLSLSDDLSENEING